MNDTEREKHLSLSGEGAKEVQCMHWEILSFFYQESVMDEEMYSFNSSRKAKRKDQDERRLVLKILQVSCLCLYIRLFIGMLWHLYRYLYLSIYTLSIQRRTLLYRSNSNSSEERQLPLSPSRCIYTHTPAVSLLVNIDRL